MIANRRITTIAVILSVVVAIMGFALVKVSSAPRVIPYYVQVDDAGGYAVVGEIQPSTIDDSQVTKSLLRRWIRDVRSVYKEGSALERTIRDAWNHIPNNSTSMAQLTAYFADDNNNPGIIAKTKTRTVHDVESISLMEKDGRTSQWRVQWLEQSIGVGDITMERWEAFITVKSEAPDNEASIKVNPLGFWVTQINWTEMATIDP